MEPPAMFGVSSNTSFNLLKFSLLLLSLLCRPFRNSVHISVFSTSVSPSIYGLFCPFIYERTFLPYYFYKEVLTSIEDYKEVTTSSGRGLIMCIYSDKNSPAEYETSSRKS